MQFLKTLFWVILAVALVLFASANWAPVTINLWAGLQADVKLPVLVLTAFLLGFLPTFLIYRARVWTLKRRLEGSQSVTVMNRPVATPVPASEPQARGEEDRVATDSKIWPA
jgi:uncharacterized integral membrane protein